MGIYSANSPSYIHLQNNKYAYLGSAVKNNSNDSVRDRSTTARIRKRLCEIKNHQYNKVTNCEKYPDYRCER